MTTRTSVTHMVGGDDLLHAKAYRYERTSVEVEAGFPAFVGVTFDGVTIQTRDHHAVAILADTLRRLADEIDYAANEAATTDEDRRAFGVGNAEAERFAECEAS